MTQLLTITPDIITGFTAALIAIIGCVILIGKGDWLIAGYNTASKEKKQKVNIKRLRGITALTCWISAIFCMLMPILLNAMSVMCLAFGFITIILILMILANTWAMKK